MQCWQFIHYLSANFLKSFRLRIVNETLKNDFNNQVQIFTLSFVRIIDSLCL